MPTMDDIYGGTALKADELAPNFRARVTIEHVSVQTVGKGEEAQKKLEVRFVGKDKTLLLNVTNANMIAEITHTRDYMAWIGHQVVIYRTMTDFGGKRVAAIRVDYPNVMPSAAPPPPPPPQAQEFQATDDDVPFVWLLPILVAIGGSLLA